MKRRFAFACVIATMAFSNSVFAQGKTVILMPGAGGATPIDFLVRNQNRIGGAGVSVIVTTSSGEAASLSQAEAAKGRKVILVGMSRGTIDVANAIASGAMALFSLREPTTTSGPHSDRLLDFHERCSSIIGATNATRRPRPRPARSSRGLAGKRLSGG